MACIRPQFKGLVATGDCGHPEITKVLCRKQVSDFDFFGIEGKIKYHMSPLASVADPTIKWRSSAPPMSPFTVSNLLGFCTPASGNTQVYGRSKKVAHPLVLTQSQRLDQSAACHPHTSPMLSPDQFPRVGVL